jgi:hypothetical protein
LSGLPKYDQRFQLVLSFHEPGLAAVSSASTSAEGDECTSYHIKSDGTPAFTVRFVRTFGFYSGLAGVVDANGNAYHIRPDGRAAFDRKWQWCGNFGQGFCVVRASHDGPDGGLFYYISTTGQITGGPYLYAGDVGSDRSSVMCGLDGQWHFESHSGACPFSLVKGQGYQSLQPLHKRIAVARDGEGMFHVDVAGVELPAHSGSSESTTDVASGPRPNRYAELEPFYNGVARFLLSNGKWGLLHEATSRQEYISARSQPDDATAVSAAPDLDSSNATACAGATSMPEIEDLCKYSGISL